jgi:hypothetical protein
MKNMIHDNFKYVILTLIITILCISIAVGSYHFILILNPVFAQTLSTITNGSIVDIRDRELAPSHIAVKEKLPSVKITSLSKGQQVPAGELEIFGTSSDTMTTKCDVSVILNGIKPYQHVIPNGQGDTGDFSKWSYSFTPHYSIINKGMNKITSKISCSDEFGTDLTKFNSVEVIGTSNNSQSFNEGLLKLEPRKVVNRTTQSSTTSITATNEPKRSIHESETEDNDIDHKSILHTNTSINNPNSKSLFVSFNIDRDPVMRGHEQTIIVTVYDSDTNARIAGAKVTGQITDTYDSVKNEFGGVTDNNGELSYSWKISETGKSTTDYKVKVGAVATGYPYKLYTTVFKVRDGHNSDTPFILAQANSKFNDGLVDSINDFTQGMLDSVKQKLNNTRNG